MKSISEPNGKTEMFVRISVAAVAFLALLAGFGCGSAERLTIDQYAEFCAEGIAATQSLVEPQSLTWADLGELASSSSEQLRAVAPPESLGDFHRASLKAMDFVAGVASEQPSEELANPLAFGFQALQIVTQLRRAVEALPTDARTRLSQAGCL